MKKITWILIICFTINLVFLNTSYANNDNTMFIDVKIGASTDYFKQYSLKSENGFEIYNKNEKDVFLFIIEDDMIYASININGDIELISLDNEILYLLPSDGSLVIHSSGDESLIKVNENNYRDYITFIEANNRISLINHIYIENYLYGVVPKEMPASWPKEALKAQALVARSFALASMNKHAKEGFSLCDTTHCQVYKAFDNEHPNTNAAVDETKGEYVYYKGKVATTPYHSSSGGYTEDSSIAWGGGNTPYLISVQDIYSEAASSNNWSLKLSPIEIKNKLAGVNIGEILDIHILDKTESNRIANLKIIGTNGEHIIKASVLRDLLGNTSMKSTMFEIEKIGETEIKKVFVIDGSLQYPVEINLSNSHILDESSNTNVNRNNINRIQSGNNITSIDGTLSSQPTTIVFSGKGYGHGVGMSQVGAMEMAKLGYNYEDIINHYYTGVDIIKINGDN